MALSVYLVGNTERRKIRPVCVFLFLKAFPKKLWKSIWYSTET